MTVALSHYAEDQRAEILQNIAINLSVDDALRWNEKWQQEGIVKQVKYGTYKKVG